MLTENRADVRLYHNGRIKINIPQYVQAICRIQTQAFPFDCQFCAVALASPLLNVNEMIVNATQPPRDSYFTGNAEWFLFNVTVRHMTFEEEGESRVEVSLGLGSLLAMTVLLGIVAGAMPKSNDIPLLGYYILVVIVLCAVAVGISMAFLAVSRHYIQKEQMPSKRLLRLMFLNEYRKRRSTIFRGVHNYRFSQECDDLMYSKVPEIQSICMMMEEIADSHRSMRRKADMKANKKLVEKEWARVFSRFDYLFLVVFETLNLSALAVFLRVAWLPTPELREQIL
uniref:Neur_chan_LBD domain-containing protein n=2 Tax=Caenorhabditis japonica TaxID=281687 RepID=A0A8R1DWT2_CAEJA